MALDYELVARQIRALRDHLDLSRDAFAAQLGADIKGTQIQDVERLKQKASADLIERIKDKFLVRAEWLMAGEGGMFPDKSTAMIMEALQAPGFADQKAGYPPLPISLGMGPAEFALVPFYDVPVSAGAGRAALDQAPKFHIGYRRDYLNRRGLIASNLLELPIAGDSMSPELESGDTVLVDKSRTNVAGDGIYVIAVDDLLYCKRLQLLPGRVLRVISINEGYKPYDVKVSEDGETPAVEIIGRVVRQGRDR